MHEADQSNLVGDLAKAHGLAGEHVAEVDFAPAKADAATVRDADGAIEIRVVGLGGGRLRR